MSHPSSIQATTPEVRHLPPKIRPMRSNDLEQVQAIDRLSFTLPWPDSAFRYELLENKRSRLLVAEVELPDGKPLVVGEVVIWLVLDEAHVATIAVHPKYRRQGIACALMAQVMKDIIRLGVRQATLEVRAHNTAAQELYRGFRFTVVGRRLRYYQDNQEDALIMTVDDLDESYIEWLEAGGQLEEGADN